MLDQRTFHSSSNSIRDAETYSERERFISNSNAFFSIFITILIIIAYSRRVQIFKDDIDHLLLLSWAMM